MRIREVMRLPGARLVLHAAFVVVVWLVLTWVTNVVDPLTNSYIALAAMYATAMFGMVILVGMSGQVSLGNGALMAVGAYCFALVSLNWQTVPIIGVPMNGWWAMVFAAIGGIVAGLVIGGLGARLKGPYLAGLTLGVAVGIPAIANRFPDLLGGEDGLMLTVPYPDGGYAPSDEGADGSTVDTGAEAGPTEVPTDLPTAGPGAGETLAPDDMLTIDDITGGGSATASVEASPSDSLAPSDTASPSDAASTDATVDAGGGSTDVSGGDSGSGDLIDGMTIEHWQAGLALLVACIVLFLALNLMRGRQGAIWRAVRDDPIAAAVSGISPAWAKVGAFVISSFFAALSGGVFAQLLSYVGPGAFGLGLSLSLLVGIVLGGRNALFGAVIGAILLVWLPVVINDAAGERGWSEQITNNMANLIYGLLVVLVVLVAPMGIVGSVGGWLKRARKRG